MRTAIYCYYNKDGKVTIDVDFICNELKRVSDVLVIVINGNVNNVEHFARYTKDIIYRDNVGLDAGAYKEIIFNRYYNEIIHKSDELILCNNSFFGPFIPLREIFYRMSLSDADFWGISTSEHDWVAHVQSYFMVFRKKVLLDNNFWDYWKNHIDEYSKDYYYVCASFENGLCRTLIKHGYSYDAYVRKIKCNQYTNPYGSLVIDGLPILKKRAFSSEYKSREKSWSAFNYICQKYNYDKELIEDYVCEAYNLGLSCNYDNSLHEDIVDNSDLVDSIIIQNFINNHKSVYIFGTGYMARSLFSLFFFYRNNPKLKGFMVSDGNTYRDDTIWGYPVNVFTKDYNNEAIIVAMNRDNSYQVSNLIKTVKDKCFVWKDMIYAPKNI